MRLLRIDPIEPYNSVLCRAIYRYNNLPEEISKKQPQTRPKGFAILKLNDCRPFETAQSARLYVFSRYNASIQNLQIILWIPFAPKAGFIVKIW